MNTEILLGFAMAFYHSGVTFQFALATINHVTNKITNYLDEMIESIE